MKIKPEVSLLGLKPEMIVALIVAEKIIDSYGAQSVITSGVEGEHSKPSSKHYLGYALDLRSRDVPEDERKDCANDISISLGSEFYCAYEKNHFHIQFNGSVK